MNLTRMDLKEKIFPSLKKPVKVFAAMCVHRGVQVRTLKMMRFFEKCPDPKIQFYIYEGDALIDRSRGRAATDFLRSDCDILFFLDDDIIFYSEVQIRDMLATMAKNSDVDILGGAYSIKDEENPVFAIRTLGDHGTYPFGKEGGLFEVRYVSSGCMAIKRHVLSRMVHEKVVHLCNPKTLNFYPFFTPCETILNGEYVYLSEDWAFCHRARELGYKVFCDSTIKLGHIGPKVYDWDDFTREKKKVSNDLIYQVDIQKQ